MVMDMFFWAPLSGILIVTVIVYKMMGEVNQIPKILGLLLVTSATFFSLVALSASAGITDSSSPWITWAQYSAIIVLSIRCFHLILRSQREQRIQP